MGIVTQNGLNISDHYLIPVIPNRLSTYGIPQILTSVESFNRRTQSNVTPLGVVITMYRSGVNSHFLTLNSLKAQSNEGKLPKIMDTIIPLAAKVSDATDYSSQGINTLKQKYGWSNSSSMESLERLTKEFLENVSVQSKGSITSHS